MEGLIKGIVSSLASILIVVASYASWDVAGPIGIFLALVCGGISAFFLLILIYGIENNDFKAGVALPFIAAFGILVAYFGQAPFELTLAVCFLSSIIAVILIQEGD